MPAQILLLGQVRIAAGSGCAIRFETGKSRELLLLLALGGGARRTREHLAAALWTEGGDDRVRRSFNTEVWRLRRALVGAGESPHAWIDADGAELRFCAPGLVEVDVLRFDALLAEAARMTDPHAERDCLAVATDLYGGELAPGHYADWCLLAREAYRGRYLAALERLLALDMATRRLPKAIACAQRILAEDPFLEHVHRELMRCHLLMGNRAAALRHFDGLCRTLRAELDVAPTAETQALAQLLRLDGAAVEASLLPDTLEAKHRPDMAAATGGGSPSLDAEQVRAVRSRLLEAARDLGVIARRLAEAERNGRPH